MRGRGRYVVEFEPPDNDAEFIATCLGIADLLTHTANHIDAWTDELAERGIPAPILTTFEQAITDLDQAAGDARRSAANFADYFEDARAIAARGIRIIGSRRRGA